jgi:hypothetical protein
MIRMLVISSRTVSTLAGSSGVSGRADGIGTAASFTLPSGIAVDSAGAVAIVVSWLFGCALRPFAPLRAPRFHSTAG